MAARQSPRVTTPLPDLGRCAAKINANNSHKLKCKEDKVIQRKEDGKFNKYSVEWKMRVDQ